MGQGHDSGDNGIPAELREQDRWLPINNVARLMKHTLPVSAKVSKDAKECMQECVSEFISFVTSEASDRCAQDKRKTINGEDILISLHSLGFENYAEVLKIYLAKYRQQQAIRNAQEAGELPVGADGALEENAREDDHEQPTGTVSRMEEDTENGTDNSTTEDRNGPK
ncbi:Hap3p KNAG_0G01480 [Huiozyma naganishii CBS 8797]|uniref:Transcription factor CBF/NF-Y/archaeal histone domain-containing protein n=1 Tax=Huiozyma naganishii (strain ATCC MYA-139 / BCRC 22969 / CBS 8797 / KCTC 17520 / NBRC 10181 / NCYC 3082 / Yp74L-3) TaxID=1071383 RepID=J7S8Z8_HUIN7|nr:hypothetical protein KNAG_0G01480 [Kazachstania naganishii CBS 8797]CCK71206.1 hypothetical protein KNAG_0G01480 [Kazachstania naganishii CBS 8797]